MNVDYSGYEMSGKEQRMFFLSGYAAIFSLCLLFYNDIFFSAAGGFAVIFAKKRYIRHKAAGRKTFLLIQFRDMLHSLSASVAAGHQMALSLEEAYKNILLIYDEKSPLAEELKYITKSISENRDDEGELLRDLGRRSGAADIKNFADVYMTCRDSGGDMGKAIASASEIIMEKIRIEREIKALTAQKRFEGRIISMMPLLVILFLNVFSPDYLEVMYATVSGRTVMTAALAAMVFSFYLTERFTDIEV